MQENEYPRFSSISVIAPIALNASLSGIILIPSASCLRIYVPPVFDGTTLTFQVSEDAVVWSNLKDMFGVEIGAANFVAGDAIQLDPQTFKSIRCLKIRSGTAAVPVVQTAARNLVVVYRDQ